ncbi:MAG: ATP-binding protein [Chloroflexota bacterium]
MSNSKQAQANLDYHAVIDNLGQGVLMFDSEDRLVLDNHAARAILGANMNLVRSEGWSACAMLIDARRLNGPSANEVRAQALRQTEPVRFHTLLAGAYTPCWATAVNGQGGTVFTMITLEQPDWTALNELMSAFRSEAITAITSTRGHAELISQMVHSHPYDSVDQLGKRVVGFADIMATHMYRLELLMQLIQRLENIRTGALAGQVRQNRRKIAVRDFLEDFFEELVDVALVDVARKEDLRDRLTVQIPGNFVVAASKEHLTAILRDLLRNAVLYSPPDSPLTLRASHTQRGATVQIDLSDQGYGIRAKEAERVFALFQRAHQPQVIREFGYGMSLYLAKAEIEAMGGRIWYESEEGVGSTFSIKLPIWREGAEDEA